MVSLVSTHSRQGQTTRAWVASCTAAVHHWALCLWIWVRKSALGVAQKTGCFGNATGHCSVLMAGSGDNGDSKRQIPQSPLASGLGWHRKNPHLLRVAGEVACSDSTLSPCLSNTLWFAQMKTPEVSLLYFGMIFSLTHVYFPSHINPTTLNVYYHFNSDYHNPFPRCL